MFTKFFKGDTKQKNRSRGESKQEWKRWVTDLKSRNELKYLFVINIDEYATDITDILNKTISQETP